MVLYLRHKYLFFLLRKTEAIARCTANDTITDSNYPTCSRLVVRLVEILLVSQQAVFDRLTHANHYQPLYYIVFLCQGVLYDFCHFFSKSYALTALKNDYAANCASSRQRFRFTRIAHRLANRNLSPVI